MLVLGVDVETTGLSFVDDRITELGMVVYDTDRNQPVRMYSEYVKAEGKAVSPEITELTGITNEDLTKYGRSPKLAMVDFLIYQGSVDYVVAHNAPFDRGMIEAEIERQEVDYEPKYWIDTSVDIPYPPSIKTRKLQHLAPDHGFLNPWSHRAVFDVLTMLKVLSKYDISRVVDLAKQPSILLQAVCKKPWEDTAPEGKKETDIARSLGFRWDGGNKQWRKIVKQEQLEHEQNGPLKIAVIGETE